MADGTSFWKRCSSCKQEIGFSTTYWVCSVSTCTRKRTGMIFCSVYCWEVHLPMMRHRESYAVEKRSPSQAGWQRENAAGAASTPAPRSGGDTGGHSGSASDSKGPVVRRRVVAPAPEAAPEDELAETRDDNDDDDLPKDILVIASKLKNYIRLRSGMNTSDTVLPTLSEHLRLLCNQAIRNAAEDGRKTVLERDIPRP